MGDGLACRVGGVLPWYFRLRSLLVPDRAVFWPRSSTRFVARRVCPHSSSRFFDGSVPTASHGLTAAFMARTIKSASVAARRSNMTRSACAEPGRWFCLLARGVGSRLPRAGFSGTAEELAAGRARARLAVHAADSEQFLLTRGVHEPIAAAGAAQLDIGVPGR